MTKKKNPTMQMPKLIKSLEQHKNIITTGRFWAFFFSKHVYFVHSRLNAKGCCLSYSFQAFDSKTYLFGFCFLFDGVLLLAFITNFQLLDILRARKAAFSVLLNFQFISSANQLSNFSKSSSTVGLFIYLFICEELAYLLQLPNKNMPTTLTSSLSGNRFHYEYLDLFLVENLNSV